MLLKRTIFSQKSGPNADAKTFEKTIALFDAKFERKPNLLYKWRLFSAMRQKKEEPVAHFELWLREKADVCEFGDVDRVDSVILVQPVPNLWNLQLKYNSLEQRTWL